MRTLLLRQAVAIALVAAGLLGPGASSIPAAVVRLEIRPADMGIAGYVRRGAWTPLRVRLRNQGTRPRQVICQWLLTDSEGDRPGYQRMVTLSPGEDQSLWLYAALPVDTTSRSRWTIAVLDAPDGAPGDVLARQVLALDQGVALLDQRTRVVGLTGRHGLGLEPYGTALQQHEATEFIRGLRPADLPDRWHGLAMLQSIIWTPAGGSPDDPDLSRGTLDAIAQWVERGGHLVIVVPARGDPWRDSLLGHLVPEVEMGAAVEQAVPEWLLPFAAQAEARSVRIHARELRPRPRTDGPPVSVLLRNRDGRPLVVTAMRGFGRVTLIGVELGARELVRRNLPNADQRFADGLWGRVFGWLSPAWPTWRIEKATESGSFVRESFRETVDLGAFLPGQISMRRTAAPALLLSMGLFVVYWLAAGPVGFMVLRRLGLGHHAWLVFAAVVLLFSVAAWSLAAVARPRQSRIEHVSVLDVRADTGQMRVHSWSALFVPRHRPVEVVTTAPGRLSVAGSIASVGLIAHQGEGGFGDPQGYAVSCVGVNRAVLPMRATSRRIELGYLGRTTDLAETALRDWALPDYRIRVRDRVLEVEVMHGLPAPLESACFIWSSGDGRMPLAWARAVWPPGELLALQPAREAGVGPLVSRPKSSQPKAGRDERKWQGYLGEMAFGIGKRRPLLRPGRTELGEQELAFTFQLLSLFDALPPPDVYAGDDMAAMMGRGPIEYDRAQGRQIDISALLATRCLIIMGLQRDAPLPMPLSVDGRTVASDGWVFLRWILPIEHTLREDGP